MPNWCSNEVTVYADSEEDLRRLLSMATKPVAGDDDEDAIPDLSPFRMESIYTTPSELMEDSNGGWYNWRVKNWGTKWDMDNVELEGIAPFGSERGKRYSFDLTYQTAWSPNIEFWKYVCNMGPFIVEMRYIEEGMGFIGETTVAKDTVDDYCINTTNEMLESIGAVLDKDGQIDWDLTEINEWDLFPLRKEKVK